MVTSDREHLPYNMTDNNQELANILVDLPATDGKDVSVVITADKATELEQLFHETWGPIQYAENTDALVQLMRETRETPYPKKVEPDVLAKFLRVAIDCILEGENDEALTGLASLVDTLEHLGTPEWSKLQ